MLVSGIQNEKQHSLAEFNSERIFVFSNLFYGIAMRMSINRKTDWFAEKTNEISKKNIQPFLSLITYLNAKLITL